ncbi:MAG: putative acetyl-CoA C-acyltransferase (thiolase) [Planctomycetota bacterium]|nr:MAG: putative acetyl-CoA C-acyltransferase (thiolase) [Planctomycetota bacterium]
MTAAGSDKGRRVVVVGGVRTPFARAFGELAELDTIRLGASVVRGLLERLQLDPRWIEEVFWGSTIFRSDAPNTGREVVLEANLPRSVPGVTVSRACLSGLQAISSAAAAIERGERELVIAGGSDSVSQAEVPLPRRLVRAVGQLAMGRERWSWRGLRQALRTLGSPAALLPERPRIAERTTGLSMGQHADDMARRAGIGRAEQDRFAMRSHQRAHAAWVAGRMAEEVVPVRLEDGTVLERDTQVRARLEPEKIASLPPVFRPGGTVTAANASPLSDGAAAVVLASAERARALGLRADVVLRGWRYDALDPFDELLLGPALSIPRLLDAFGLGLAEVDLFELHEAFAAQVLRVLQALGEERFARERLGRERAVGPIPDERLNVHGGSIALGHPFAATGVRLVLTAAIELRRRAARRAVVALCAGGGMGGAALLERMD